MAGKQSLNEVEQERARIGLELHDGVGQVLTGALAMTEALEFKLTGKLQQDAARVRELVADALKQVRCLSHGLVPLDLGKEGINAALGRLATTMSSELVKCELVSALADRSVSSAVGLHLLRIAQEAISNAIRHGKARRIEIRLFAKPKFGGLLEVDDDGCGLSSSEQKSDAGLGLRSMKERARAIRGRLKLRSKQPHGVILECHFPCGYRGGR